MEKEALREFIAERVGPGKRFKNLYEWSRTSGIPDQTLARVRDSGTASTDTLIALARSVGMSTLELLKQQGVLRPEEVDTQVLAPPENELVELYRALATDPVAQATFLEGCRLSAQGYERLLKARASGALD